MYIASDRKALIQLMNVRPLVSRLLIVCVLIFGFHPLMAQMGEIEKLKLKISNEKDPKTEVDLLLQLADQYKFGEPHKALESAKLAENKALDSDYEWGILKSKKLIAAVYWSISDYQKAMQYAVQALTLAEKLESKADRAALLRTIGIILGDLGETKKSAEYFFASLKMCEELGDKDGIGKSYNSIGHAYISEGNREKAAEYFHQSLDIARELNDQEGISRSLSNIAIVYKDQKDLEYKKTLLFEAVRINREIGQKYWEAINYMNIGDVYLQQEMMDSSFFYYSKSETILTDLNNIPRLASAYLLLSTYFNKAGNADESLRYAKQAMALGKKNKLSSVVLSASKHLADWYLAKNDSLNALEFIIDYHTIKDSLNIENNLARITQLELTHELEKLEQERRLQAQKRTFRFTVIILLLLFLGLSIIFILVARHRIQRKNEAMKRHQLNNELELKNKELTLNVMSLMKKNELLSNIASKLMLVQKNAVKDETKVAIRNIVKDLKKTSETEVWQEFEMRFKQVHGDFYQNLVHKYPDLTPNELKICAFMRLNLSTKEISELTGQRVATIEIARSRLRKKLGLTHSQLSLVNFLSQL